MICKFSLNLTDKIAASCVVIFFCRGDVAKFGFRLNVMAYGSCTNLHIWNTSVLFKMRKYDHWHFGVFSRTSPITSTIQYRGNFGPFFFPIWMTRNSFPRLTLIPRTRWWRLKRWILLSKNYLSRTTIFKKKCAKCNTIAFLYTCKAGNQRTNKNEYSRVKCGFHWRNLNFCWRKKSRFS